MSEKIRLYYYMEAKYLEPFLKTHELKLTNLADTNDPFEVLRKCYMRFATGR